MVHLTAYESSSEDEFPDVRTLVERASKKNPGLDNGIKPRESSKASGAAKTVKTTAVRRRKLGQLSDNQLLRPWALGGNATPSETSGSSASLTTETRTRPKVQLRARKQKTGAQITPVHGEAEEEHDSSEDKEETFVEEATVDDDSDFNETLDFYSAEEENVPNTPPPRLPTGTSRRQPATTRPKPLPKKMEPPSKNTTSKLLGSIRSAIPLEEDEQPKSKENMPQQFKSRKSAETKLEVDVAYLLDQMDINAVDMPQEWPRRKASSTRPTTPPPSTPPKARPAGLVSPTKKLARIPSTPHHPESDLFWSREFVDDWNDEHSPKKQLFPDPSRSPAKPASSPKKKGGTSKTASEKEAKKAFEQARQDIAVQFLGELDTTITQGRIAELAESTGGVKIVWSNKLNTTAGRANWKRETVRSVQADGTKTFVRENHHASIELAEKVIDNEHRLLNTLAHEFCHLANFMISRISTNPHGKEFKAWAAQCSRAFASRGIEVTTKHSYDIDFKFVWECIACAAEYKRHSRSIDPKRHRCGGCKGELKQTKPTPRATAGKASDYQVFMKEQMKLLKEENPKSPQKDIMRLVADRWSSRQGASKTATQGTKGTKKDDKADAVASAFIDLTLD